MRATPLFARFGYPVGVIHQRASHVAGILVNTLHRVKAPADRMHGYGVSSLDTSPPNVQTDACTMSTALPQAVQSRLDSPDRLAAVARLGLLGTPREEAFDRLTRLAARVLGVRGALVTITTAEVQFCKSSVGLPEPWATSGLPLTYGLCPYTVASGEPLLVADARVDPRFHDNPGVRELGVAAYAGVPLLTTMGKRLAPSAPSTIGRAPGQRKICARSRIWPRRP